MLLWLTYPTALLFFTGCDDKKKPLVRHGHAHIFCESYFGAGKASGAEISHITIYASMGFSFEDMQALEDLKEIWEGKDPAVRLVLQELGRREDFCGKDPERWPSPLPMCPSRGSHVADGKQDLLTL